MQPWYHSAQNVALCTLLHLRRVGESVRRVHSRVLSALIAKALPETHGIASPVTSRICECCTREASRFILFQNGSDIEESPYTLYVHYYNHLTWVFEQISILEIYFAQYHPGTSFLI